MGLQSVSEIDSALFDMRQQRELAEFDVATTSGIDRMTSFAKMVGHQISSYFKLRARTTQDVLSGHDFSSHHGSIIAQQADIASSTDPFFIVKDAAARAHGFACWTASKDKETQTSLKRGFREVGRLAGYTRDKVAKLKTSGSSPLQSLIYLNNNEWRPEVHDAINAEVAPLISKAQPMIMEKQLGWDLHKSRDALRVDAHVQKRIVARLREDIGLPSPGNGRCVMGDVSLTRGFYEMTRSSIEVFPEDLVQTVLDAMHEFGHELYRRNLSPAFKNSVHGDVASDTADEAAALFYENFVARTPAFASYLHATLQDVLGDEMPENLTENLIRQRLLSVWDKDNVASPDHIVYPMQTAATLGVARRLVDERQDAQGLPDLYTQAWIDCGLIQEGGDFQRQNWHAFMREQANDKLHFFAGEFDRWAAYNNGHFAAAQLFQAMRVDGIDPLTDDASIDFAAIKNWMSSNVFCKGRSDRFDKILEDVTGDKLNARGASRHIWDQSNLIQNTHPSL